MSAVRVLIAEDETLIRMDLRLLLERAGHVVVGEARDGDEAVALAAALSPHVVIMDVKMPRLDGIDAARRILAERPVPIVMLTAYAQADLIERATDAGVFGYLVKPFREQDLVPAIATARARFAEMQAVRAQAASLEEALAARRLIEQAKGVLMRREDLSEAAAFARIRAASQRSGRPMRVIAEALLATFTDPEPPAGDADPKPGSTM
jgi:two-component system, response regulator PdtaR